MLNLVPLVSNTSYILAARHRCPVQLVDATVAIVASLILFEVALGNGDLKRSYRGMIEVHKASNSRRQD